MKTSKVQIPMGIEESKEKVHHDTLANDLNHFENVYSLC